MQVFLRADASVTIGTGHIVRCATLAGALHQRGIEVAFACVPQTGHLNDWLKSQGFTVYSLPDQSSEAMLALLEMHSLHPDWLIVDHYGLNRHWETAMRQAVGRILVIDDLVSCAHDCDALLNQNSLDSRQTLARYQAILPETLPKTIRYLLGPQYALLRPSFIEARQVLRQDQYRHRRWNGPVRRLLVFMGGTDPTGETRRILNGLKDRSGALVVDVVVGAGNPQREAIAQACAMHPLWRFHCQTEAMADLMMKADFAMTAGGATTWEKLCLGLPSLVIAVADNQFEVSREVSTAGAQAFLGVSPALASTASDWPVATDERLYAVLLDEWLSDSSAEARQAMAQKALFLVDGQGAERVADFLETR